MRHGKDSPEVGPVVWVDGEQVPDVDVILLEEDEGDRPTRVWTHEAYVYAALGEVEHWSGRARGLLRAGASRDEVSLVLTKLAYWVSQARRSGITDSVYSLVRPRE